MIGHKLRHFICMLCIWAILPCAVVAAPPTTLPGPADPGRIKSEERIPQFEREDDGSVAIPEGAPLVAAPESAKKIKLVLKEVSIEGATVFSQDELKDIYAGYIGKEVTLDVAWQIAGGITERYRANGYFLSRAYVPGQSVKGGKIIIKVVEGYIGDVELQDDNVSNYVIRRYVNDIKNKKPVKAAEVESFLLRLNDLPGLSFRAVLSLIESQAEANAGAVKLTLVPGGAASRAIISFDNNGSRFLGPYEASATFQTSIIPLQRTTLSTLASIPADELKYGTLTQTAVIAPDTTLELSGGYTKAIPGFNLEQFEIESISKSLSLGLNYQMIRQRDENLNLKLTFDARNTSSEILNTILTKDRVRAVRASINYDVMDRWNGYNTGSFGYSRGLNKFGSSDEGDLNLSRGDATPDFNKFELSLARLQRISDDWLVALSTVGQFSTDPLFSSEEFGYGGQALGRAYDSSEITGDDGFGASAELRFNGIANLQPVSLTPYVFYDIGRVWQEGTSSTLSTATSGSSAGFGVRFDTTFHLSGNIGLAFPLTLPVGTPIYGYANEKNPRFLFQLSQEF